MEPMHSEARAATRSERVVYNPFLLYALYQRVYYRTRIESILKNHSSLKIEDTIFIRDNNQDLVITKELSFFLDLMKKEKIQFDFTLSCLEMVLCNAFQLFFPKRGVQVYSDAIQKLDDRVTRCEDYLLYMLDSLVSNEGEEEEWREIFTKVLLIFLERHYVPGCESNEESIILFFQVKKSFESFKEETVTIEYTLEEISFIYYLFLLNELISISHEEVPFLKLLYEGLREEYMRVLSLSLFSTLPEKESFVILKPQHEEVLRMVQKKKTFFFVPKSTKHLLYLKLSVDGHHYQYIVRRFILDCSLRVTHEEQCLSEGCLLCHYFDVDKMTRNLSEFYAMVECKRDSHIYLESLVLDRCEAIDSVVYKNLWQTMKILQKRGNPMLFYVIHVAKVVDYVRKNYEQYEGEGSYRKTLLLNGAKRLVRSNTLFRVDKWQEALAIDQDIFQLIFSAMMNQLETLKKSARILSIDEKCSVLVDTLCLELSEILLLYQSILCDSMQ